MPATSPTSAAVGLASHSWLPKAGKTDQGAAEKADDASADEAHEERAFEGEVKEAVAENAQDDSDRERWSEEKKQHDFLIGVADFCK